MCFLSIPSPPKIPTPAPAPTMQSPEVLQARGLQRKAQLLTSGRASTLLTGPTGLVGPPPAGYGKQLLGS